MRGQPSLQGPHPLQGLSLLGEGLFTQAGQGGFEDTSLLWCQL